MDAWFLDRPNRYKGILAYSLTHEPGVREPVWRSPDRLHGFKAPDSMAKFWLELAERETTPSLATQYFEQAAYFTKTTSSLDTLEAWVDGRPEFREAFEAIRNPPVPEWQIANLPRQRTQAAKDRERIEQYRQALTGKAPAEVGTLVLHNLAMAWLGHVSQARGDSPRDRFANFFKGDATLVNTALAALAATPTRSDLPPDAYILALSLGGKTPNLCHPLLVGLSLAFDTDTQAFERVGADTHIKGLI